MVLAYKLPFEDKFIPEPNTGCWLWLGHIKWDGYGQVRYNGKQTRAHIASYEMHNGPLNGLYVLHKCDQRSCVNPEHLFLGTQQDNMNDMVKKNRQVVLVGENKASAKLTESTVKEIFQSTLTRSELAELYSITPPHVSNIKLGRKWKHLNLAVVV